MEAKKSRDTREGIARMRKITRDVGKLNGRIHSSSAKNGSARAATKPRKTP